MKSQKSLKNSVSVLIAAVLAITAFVPESSRLGLYVSVFLVWGIWANAAGFLTHQETCSQNKEEQKEQSHSAKKQEILNPPAGSSVHDILLRHANARITVFLKSSYPDATWRWCEEHPERIVANGGKGRIQVFGIDEYNYGEVTFDRNAGMTCTLLKIVPLTAGGTKRDSENASETNPPQKSADPQVWFDQYGQDILIKLIADLNANGHHRLLICENGDVTVMQEDKTITNRYFESVPEKKRWNRLVGVLESAGIAGEVQNDGISVTW